MPLLSPIVTLNFSDTDFLVAPLEIRQGIGAGVAFLRPELTTYRLTLNMAGTDPPLGSTEILHGSVALESTVSLDTYIDQDGIEQMFFPWSPIGQMGLAISPQPILRRAVFAGADRWVRASWKIQAVDLGFVLGTELPAGPMPPVVISPAQCTFSLHVEGH